MLDPMVATAGVDLVIVTAWVGGVTLLLLGRALISWRRFRHNSNFALQARRLPVALPIEKTRGPAALAPTRPSAPSTGYLLKRLLLGRPLATERLAHERLGKPTAMAVFSSDNMSSVAYATEEILR